MAEYALRLTGSKMLTEGLNLMIVGMVTVFGFLTLMVVVLQISARFFEVFGDRWPDSEEARLAPQLSPSLRQDVEVAVVLAAIEAHRRR